MKTLRFMGHSDDTFGEYGTTMDDIDNAGSGDPIQCDVEADGTALIVTGQYDRNGTGTWDIGISLQDEDLSYPDWDMRISFEGYTTILEIDVPDDVELTWYNNGERTVQKMLGFLIGVIFGGTVALIAMSLTMYPDCEDDEDDEKQIPT